MLREAPAWKVEYAECMCVERVTLLPKILYAVLPRLVLSGTGLGGITVFLGINKKAKCSNCSLEPGLQTWAAISLDAASIKRGDTEGDPSRHRCIQRMGQ